MFISPPVCKPSPHSSPSVGMWFGVKAESSPQTRRLAWWSLILGLTGFITGVVGIGVLLALAAVVSAGIALVRLRPWHAHDGHAIALCGLIAGVAALLAFPVWMTTVIPRFVAAYRNHQAQECRANLQTIALAKEQWAAAHHATNGTVVAANIVFPAAALPRCPAGGKYRVNAIGMPPECSISWHNPR